MKKFFVFILLTILFGLITNPSYAQTIHDNFNDGNNDGWIVVPPYSTAPTDNHNWRVEDKMVKQDFGSDGYKLLFNNHQVSNQSIQAKMLWNDNGQVGITVWHKDIDNRINILFPVGGGFRISEKWCDILPCERDENISHFDYPYPFTERKWVTFRVDANSFTGELKAYLDGIYVFTHTVGNNIYRAGLSGFNSYNAGGSFDNFFIKRLAIIRTD